VRFVAVTQYKDLNLIVTNKLLFRMMSKQFT